MNFARFFKTYSYCLIGSGFLAVGATGAINWIAMALFGGFFIGSWFIDTAALRRRIPAWVLNCLAVAYLPFFAIDLGLVSRSFLISTVHLIFFLAALRLLTLAQDRDYLLLYLLSFAKLLAATALTANIVFGLCFLAFLLSGIVTLVLFEMRRSSVGMLSRAAVQPFVTPQNLKGTGLELFSPFPAATLHWTAIGIALFVLALAVPLFLLLPRSGSGGFKPPTGKTRYISGFSDHVELGRLGTIKQSDALVMRVRASQPPAELPADLKWRGISFDYYDGRSWRRSDLRRHPIPVQGRYYKLENSAQGTKWIHQSFFIEALSTDVVFAAHKALAVSREAGWLQRDSTESLYAERGPQKKLRYDAISDPIRPDPGNISDCEPIPGEILTTYLQLPSRNPRISDLAAAATREAPTKYAQARALEQYLLTHYRYSLNLRGTPNNPDPLAVFLFDIREGHCEYFASAMAIMLRHLGIPSRLVNGFRMGEYNRIGENYTVRQYHAHSWVEAYFPPYGWIEFDPTPADPQRPRAAFIQILSNLTEAIDLWWWEGVVNFDAYRQYRMISDLLARLEDVRIRAKNLLKIVLADSLSGISQFFPRSAPALIKEWMLWMPWVPAVLVMFIRPWRKRIFSLIRRRRFRKNARLMAGSFYTEALEMLEKYGIKRARGETPLEFAQNLAHHPTGLPLLALTRIFNAIRFGPPGVPFPREEAETQLHSLRRSLRRR